MSESAIAALLLAGKGHVLYPSGRPSTTRAVANPGTLIWLQARGLLTRLRTDDGSAEYKITKSGRGVYLGLLKQQKRRVAT